MRLNLERIRDGKEVKTIVIGTLTPEQLEAINAHKLEQELPLIINEITFVGRHIYQSRVEENGYTIEDVLDQIYSGMDPSSVVDADGWQTGLKNPVKRTDRYGKQVNDLVTFLCSSKDSCPELWGVIPKGDRRYKAKK
jgi:hypothetical protein